MRKRCLPFGAYYAPIQERAARAGCGVPPLAGNGPVGTTVTIWHDRPDGDPHLPALRPQEDGDHANQRLRSLLRVRGLPNGSPAETWRLLRLLLLWIEPMPTPTD